MRHTRPVAASLALLIVALLGRSLVGADPGAPLPVPPTVAPPPATSDPSGGRDEMRSPAPARTGPRTRASAPAALPEADQPPAAEPSEEQVSAWLSAGEAAMDGGDLATATASYRNIVDEAPDARVAPYALYKLAWCDRNAGRTDDAIRDLELLLEWARSGDVPGAVPLIEAATADLERFGEALAATPAEPLTER